MHEGSVATTEASSNRGRGFARRIAPLLAVGDVLVYWAMVWVAFEVRFLGHPSAYNVQAAYRLIPWGTVALLVVFWLSRLYVVPPESPEKTREQLVTAVTLQTMALGALTFLLGALGFPRTILLIGWPLNLLGLTLWRSGANRWVAGLLPVERVLVITTTLEEAQLALERLEGSGIPREVMVTHELPDGDTLAQADTVVMGTGLSDQEKQDLAMQAFARGIRVAVVPSVYEILLMGARLQQYGDLPTIELTGFALPVELQAYKRAMDLVLGLMLLVVLSPVLLLISALVVLTSGFPVIYRQERVGLGGRPFTLYKFRTMVPGAESGTGPVLATPGDPRVTRLGRWLRRFHLDELPQLVNVILGEMSLVGPRPERPPFVEQFSREYQAYPTRLLVKAGITGLAQVNGQYETRMQDKVRLDLVYARRYTIATDFLLLVRTIARAIAEGISGQR